MDSFFPFRDPAFTTFLDDEHFGHAGGFACSKSEKSVGRDLVFDLDFISFFLVGIFWIKRNGL